MLGGINVASYGLMVGAAGQALLYRRVFTHVPNGLILGVLFLPWLTVFTISFCKAAPCGPRRFRHLLTGAMCGYALATLFAEGLQAVAHEQSAYG